MRTVHNTCGAIIERRGVQEAYNNHPSWNGILMWIVERSIIVAKIVRRGVTAPSLRWTTHPANDASAAGAPSGVHLARDECVHGTGRQENFGRCNCVQSLQDMSPGPNSVAAAGHCARHVTVRDGVNRAACQGRAAGATLEAQHRQPLQLPPCEGFFWASFVWGSVLPDLSTAVLCPAVQDARSLAVPPRLARHIPRLQQQLRLAGCTRAHSVCSLGDARPLGSAWALRHLVALDVHSPLQHVWGARRELEPGQLLVVEVHTVEWRHPAWGHTDVWNQLGMGSSTHDPKHMPQHMPQGRMIPPLGPTKTHPVL